MYLTVSVFRVYSDLVQITAVHPLFLKNYISELREQQVYWESTEK